MPDDILNKIISDDNLKDDDHPDKKDITEKEAEEALKQLAEKYKDRKPLTEGNKKFSDGVIDALNKL